MVEPVPESTSAFVPPERFDSFVVERPLGRGGMGHVYLGREEMLDRKVALKFIAQAAPTAAARARFVTEARAIAKLAHPNVVGVFRIGEVSGHPYIAYELVRGQSLDKIQRPLKWTSVLRIATQIARGLAAAHRAGVVHRDVKLANVMLSDEGQIKLLDFGLAKLDDEPPSDSPSEPTGGRSDQSGARHATGLTRPGLIVGTPSYLAPELWLGEGATPRSDLYAFGIVLFELLTGEVPVSSAVTRELAEQVITTDVPPIRSRCPDVPESLARVVDGCTKRHALERFATADEVRVALEEIESVFLPASMGIDAISLQGEPMTTAASLARLSESMEAVTKEIYSGIFARLPETRVLFPEDLGSQREKLWHALRLAVEGLREPEKLAPVLRDLGRRHVGYGVVPEHYDLLGEVLLEVLERHDPDPWTDDLRRAWKRAYAFVMGAMRRGADDGAATRGPSRAVSPLATTPSPKDDSGPRSRPSRPEGLRTRYAKNGATSLAYQTFGRGPIDLVVLPGWLTHVEMAHEHPSLAGFLGHFAQTCRVTIFDKRGAGLSDRADRVLSVEDRVADLRAVLDAASVQLPVLLGIGEGASVAAAYAIAHPGRVRGVVAYAATARLVRDEGYRHGHTEAHFEEIVAQVEESWGEPVFVELEAPSRVGDETFTDWLGAYMRMSASPGSAVAMLREYAAMDVRLVLPSLLAPTLVVHRKGDLFVPVEAGRYFASLVPGSTFVELEGEDHLPYVGQVDAVQATIDKFLRGLMPTRELG